MEVGSIADVLEEYAASIMKVEVSRRSEPSCYIGWQPNRPVERGLGASSGSVWNANRKFGQIL